MIWINNKAWIWVWFCCFSFAFAQQEKISLAMFLQDLEQKFEVKFSYAVNDIKNRYVEKQTEFTNLQQAITVLKEQVPLNFRFLNHRYIAITTLPKDIFATGIVCGLPTKKPILGATILVKHRQYGVAANALGEFQINKLNLKDTLLIKAIGYQTKEVAVRSLKQRDTILLPAQIETLNSIVIYKYLTSGLQKHADGTTVLQTKKFGVLPGLTSPDILQSIQALPGIESANESIANINVRGGTNDQNLILWDGIKMYHTGHFFGLISAYNPYLTSKVEVTKNGTSSEYSNGVSSTIRMYTKYTIQPKVKGGAGFNLLSTDAFVEIPVSGRRSYTDVINTPTYAAYFKRSFQNSQIAIEKPNHQNASNFYFYDYTAKLLYQLHAKQQTSITAIGIFNHLNFKEATANNTQQDITQTNHLSQKNWGVGSTWKSLWNQNFTTQLQVFYSKYLIDAVDFKTETNQKLNQNNQVLDVGIKWKGAYQVNAKNNWMFGYEFSETGILNKTIVNAPVFSRIKKDVLKHHAWFSEWIYKNQQTLVKTGIRCNYFQKFHTFLWEPRLHVRQQLVQRIAMYIQGEMKHQTAAQTIDFQNNFFGIEKRRWILANNQDTPIAISKQVSIGWDFNAKGWLISLEGFYKQVKGITAANQGFYNNFQYVRATGE